MFKRSMYFARGVSVACFKAAVVSTTIATPNATAAQDRGTGAWDYGLNIYLWGAGIGGTAFNGQDIDVSFSDLASNLDFGLMGSFVARRDRLAYFIDGLHLNVSNSQSGTLGPIGAVPVSAGAKIKGFVATGGAGYNCANTEKLKFTAFGGVRELFLDTTLDLNIGPVRVPNSASNNYIDAIAGVRGRTKFDDRWAITYYGDVGTGQSNSTFQAAVSVMAG